MISVRLLFQGNSSGLLMRSCESRGCEDFQLLKHGYEPVPQLDRCTKVEAEGEKGTICVCSESLCNTSTMLNGGMVLVFALMGIFMLKI